LRPYLALRHRDYRRLVASQLFSLIGSQMQTVGINWREGALRYASLAATLGAAPTESAEELKAAWKLLGGGPKGEDR
jgi:hypothetical protein